MTHDSQQLVEASARPALEGIGRRLMIPVVLALLVLLAMALVADARELARAVAAFDYGLLAPVLALSLVNYGLRFVRWQSYLDALEIRLSRRDSLGIFLVGFVLSVTPGKAGELGKAWMARALGGGAARRAVAVVLAERILDVLGMLILIAMGALAFPGGLWIALGCLGTCLALLVVLSWRRAAHWAIGVAARLPRVGSMVEVLGEVYDHLRRLLAARTLGWGLLLSIVAWAAEGVGFGLVVRSYAPEAGWLASLFNYSASTLFGALSMLPGGLLASEGALTALLGWQGLETAAAASATLVIRVATLWFAVALGLLALPWTLRRLRAG